MAPKSGKQSKHITIVIPIYNEEAALPLYFDAMSAEIPKIKKQIKTDLSFTLLFVNDGSHDASEFIVRNAKQKEYAVQLVNFSRNFGKEKALFAGMNYAQGDAVIPMDVDLQDTPEIVGKLIERWLDGVQIVNAKRVSRTEDIWWKRMTANLFYKVFNLFSEKPIPENVGDFRLLDRQVVDAFNQIGDQKRFNKEIFSWVGFQSEEVEFDRPQRSEGEGKWSFWKLWNFALDGIFSASTLPLRLWGYIGFLISLSAFAYVLLVIFYTLVFGRDLPGYSSTIVMILMFGGLNLLSLGILGEYIGRIYAEVRNRPSFIVQSTFGMDEDE